MIERVRVVHPEGGRMMTKQSMAAQTDVNQIVARHVAHGVPFPDGGGAGYGDFSSALDYHSALNSIREAQDTFLRLPAAVREYCENDPGKFLDLVVDPARRDELVKLGLIPAMMPVPAEGSPSGEGARATAPSAGTGSPASGGSSSSSGGASNG